MAFQAPTAKRLRTGTFRRVKTLLPIRKVCITHSHMKESVLGTCTFSLFFSAPTREMRGWRRHNPLRELFRIIGETYCEYYNHTSSDGFKLGFFLFGKNLMNSCMRIFTESKSPDILIGVQSQLLHKRGRLLTLHTLPLHSFARGYISSWHPKKKKKRGEGIPLLEILKMCD